MKRITLPVALSIGALVASGAGVAGSELAQAAPLPSITVAVHSKTSISVSGTLQSGGVNVLGTSTVKESNVILFLLKPGVSVGEVEAFLSTHKVNDPNVVSKFGTIVFDTEAGPGHNSEAQTYLQPGQYLALGGTGEGTPSARTSFTVSASPAPVALPAPQATERSIDFGFRGPTTLHDRELVRFENEGYVVHMDFAAPVKNVASARKLIQALLAGNDKAFGKLVTGEPAAFAGPLSTGGFQQETITAKPGVYVQLCFMETQDGRDHTLLGMERMIKIVK